MPGDNLAAVLAQRAADLAPPMHMCDAHAASARKDQRLAAEAQRAARMPTRTTNF